MSMAHQDPNDLVHEFPRLLRVYKDGRIERLSGTQTIPPSTDPLTGVQSKDVTIFPETGVSARLFLPKTSADQKLPLLIYIHGGAFCVASPFNPLFHKHVSSLAAEANVVALSVHYRLAPEHPLPIAYDDTWTAIQWAASHSGGAGREAWLNEHADFGRVFLAGDSAGANIAHNMGMRAKEDGLDGFNLVGLVLVHPFFSDGKPDKLIEFLFPSMDGPDDPRINAAKDPKLSRLGCSKVLVLIAGKDFLRERGLSYHEALKDCGWKGKVEMVETEGEEHVFHIFNQNTDKAVALVKQIASFINQQ